MDICPCRFMSDGRWHVTAVRLRCPQHENGPPDIKTIDRRRVAPPAGCRVTAEPATVAGRRSAERCTTEEQPNSALHQQRTRQPNIEQFTALAARAWGRRAASRCLAVVAAGRIGGQALASPGGLGAARRGDPARAMHISWRRAALFSGDAPRLHTTTSRTGRVCAYRSESPRLMRPTCITDRTLPRGQGSCITERPGERAPKHDRFRQVRARHCPHVQHRIGTDHPGGARTRDPGRASPTPAPGRQRPEDRARRSLDTGAPPSAPPVERSLALERAPSR